MPLPTDPYLVWVFQPSQYPELRETLDRAMNTWEPQDRPSWLQPLSDAVDAKLGQAVFP